MPRGANRVAPSIAQEIARQIAKQVGRTEEVKQYISSLSDYNPNYPTSTIAPSLIDCRLAPPLGTGSQNRVGEKIRVKSYKYSVNGWFQGSAFNPCRMRFIVCKLRGAPSTLPTASQVNSLKRTNSQGVTSGVYSSTKTTQLTPYNDELWEVLETKDFKLGLANTTATPNFVNNDFSAEFQHTFDLTSYIKREALFDDSSGITPGVQINDGLIIFVMCLDVNEAVPIAASGSTPRIDSVLCCEFTDA